MSTNYTEEIKVTGEQLLAKIKSIIHEGNVHSITIKDKDGHIIFTIPMTFGVIGVLIAPTLAAISAVAAVVTDCTVSIERRGDNE